MRAQTKHGFSYHPHYKRWLSLNDRCTDLKNIGYHYYGGRGITVCNKWSKKAGPKVFCEWADKTYVEGMQIDRIDNNKGYSPENCRWVTASKNIRNRNPLHKKSLLPEGVVECKDCSYKKYRSRIMINGKRFSLGFFASTEEASNAYQTKKKQRDIECGY